MKAVLSFFLLITSLSSIANADSGAPANYDCGLVDGLVSGSKVLSARAGMYGNVQVFKAVIDMKYEEGGKMRDELRSAAKKVSKQSISKALEDVANRINSSLDSFYGDINVWSRKVDELDRTFFDASNSLKTLSDFVCGR